ncbi:MAG: HEAT repeat domain-containing protein [Planctomycetota bacterium]
MRKSGQAAAIPYIAFLLEHKDREVAGLASEVIAGLTCRLGGVGFARLDAWMRTFAPWNHASVRRWMDVAPDRLRVLPHWEAAVGIASMHHDGHKREAALRLLAAATTGAEVPFLMVRLNDWVEPVRELAYRLVEKRMRPGYELHFARNLGLLMRLEHCHRSDHGRLLGRVSDLLRRPESRPSLVDAMRMPDPLVGRLAFKLLTDPPMDDLAEVLSAALDSEHPVVRLRAAQKALESQQGDALCEMLARIRRDRFMPVRRAAVLYIVKQNPHGCLDVLKQAMLDRSVSMRWTARYYAEKLFGFDSASHYRAMLSAADSPGVAPALAGLGDCGEARDAERVSRFLDHPLTRVRRTAVKALGKLAEAERITEFIRALADEKGSVSREARRALVPRAQHAGVDVLWGLVSGGRRPHTRRNALLVLGALPRWQRLPYLIQACASADEELSLTGHGLVKAWLYRGAYARPTATEAAAARDAIDRHEEVLGRHIAGELRFML